MNKKRFVVSLACVLMITLVLLSFALPAKAFDSRSGGNIEIGSNETVDDDLYVMAGNFTLKGTIKGDLIAMGNTIIIEPGGVVEGDLMAGGQVIEISGDIQGDVRVGGAVISVMGEAQIGEDLVAAGYSLEQARDAIVGGDILLYGSQVQLSGEVAGDATVGVSTAFLMNGAVNGDLNVDISDPQQAPPFNFFSLIPGMPAVPTLPGGFKIMEEARIEGDLSYISPESVDIPAGAVVGAVTHNEPPEPEEPVRREPTAAEKGFRWFVNLLQSLASMLVVGLFTAWVFPNFVSSGASTLRDKPLPSLLWGVVTIIAFIFLIFLVVVVIVALSVILGLITLGDLLSVTVSAGGIIISSLIWTFKLAFSYLSKIVVAALVGALILSPIKPDWAEGRYWPLVLGVILVAILIAIPYLGVLFNILVVLFGLGAIWLIGRDWLSKVIDGRQTSLPEMAESPASE